MLFVAETTESEAVTKSGGSPYFEYKFPKQSQSDKFFKERLELEAKLDKKGKEAQEKQKKIFELQDKVREFSQMEFQVKEKTRQLDASNMKRNIFEKELIATRSELASVKSTLGNIYNFVIIIIAKSMYCQIVINIRGRKFM